MNYTIDVGPKAMLESNRFNISLTNIPQAYKEETDRNQIMDKDRILIKMGQH